MKQHSIKVALGAALLMGLPVMALLSWAMGIIKPATAHDHGDAAAKCAVVHSPGEAAHYLFQKWDYHAAGHTALPKPLPEWDFYGEQTIDEWVTANGIDAAAWRRAIESFSVNAFHYDAGIDVYTLGSSANHNLLYPEYGADWDLIGRFGIYLFPDDRAYRHMTNNVRACVHYVGARPTSTATLTE